MKFSVPTNFQNDLLPGLLPYKDKVLGLYGKLPEDFVGGGRPSLTLAAINRRQLRNYVAKIHANGLRFNYLLNAACMGNTEFTISGQRHIRRLLDWLTELRVDSVTVALPYLAQLVKRNYPHFKLHISNFSHIDTITKARYWQDLGADSLVLDSFSLNRDFETLQKIRQKISCNLELIANNTCLYQCPIRYFHRTTLAHASQSNHPFGKNYFIDYCVIHCRLRRLKDPVHFIRSDWIRPEDVAAYEAIGINTLKIVDRTASTGFILNAVRAYTESRYAGNLADLFTFTSRQSCLSGPKRYLHYLKHMPKPWVLNALRARQTYSYPPLDVHIDNRALDGFLEHFKQGKCRRGFCEECGYCRRITDKAVKMDEGCKQKALAHYQAMSDTLASDHPF